jgi:hypothetical protein
VSLCVVTASSPTHLAAWLSVWRPHVDEIVVAVDERADSATVAAASRLADLVHVVPPMPNPERYDAWLIAQCGGDWALRMSDDELPSEALLARLPQMLASREHVAFVMPRRWLFPDPAHYVVSHAWAIDLHPRLIRAIPGLVRARGRVLVEPEALGAHAVVDAAFLTLAALRHPLARRRTWPSRGTQSGLDVSSWSREAVGRLAVPEDDDVQTVRLPHADAERAAGFLEAIGRAEPVSAPTGGVDPTAAPRPVVDVRQIDDRLIEIASADAEHGAEVRLLTPLDPLAGGQRCLVLVDVTNTGSGTWPAGGDGWPPISVGVRWSDVAGVRLPDIQPRSHFTERVVPSATTRMLVGCIAPDEPGEYRLSISVVEEMVRWLEPAATQTVTVAASARALEFSTQPTQPHPQPSDRRLQRRRRARGRAQIFTDDLRRLNDALAPTAFGDSYWVWGGMLLGWAREGRLLGADLFDADFAFVAGEPSFDKAIRTLVAAGFEPRARFCTNDGEPYEWRFVTNGGQFEFFAMTPIAGRHRYHIATVGGPGLAPPNIARAEITAQHLVPFTFLRRTWLKSEDHERELTAIYGDWRTPHPDHWWMNDRAIVSREPWSQTVTDWDGPRDGPCGS